MTVRDVRTGRTRAVLLCCALVGAFAVDLRVQPGGAAVTKAVDDLGEMVAALVAAIAALARGRRCDGRSRRSWLLLAAATGSWAAGEAIWCYYELIAGHETPFPSLADAAFLLFPVLALLGLLVRPSAAFTGQGRLRVLFDGMLVATSLFVVSWATALGEIQRTSSDDRLATFVSLAYPVSDVLLLTVVVVVVAHASAGARSGLLLLAAGLVSLSVADSGFAYLTAIGSYATGNLIDAGWVGGFLVLALAAQLDHESAEAGALSPVPRAALLLPYLPATVGICTALYRVHGRPHDSVSLVAAMTVLSVLVARQVVVLLDNRTLVARISHQAFHDALTGLANRALFLDRLTHALDLQRRDLRPVTVLLVDLDDFKTVNDSLGHPAGDELLVRISERLRATVRTGDTVARLGGDEFAVLVEDGGDPMLVAGRLLSSLDQPVVVGRRELPVRASVGAATLAAADGPASAADMLKRADVAMYAAKRAGKSTAVLYTSGLCEGDADSLDMRTALAADLECGRIDVAYQPIHLADGRLRGFEALARWSYGGKSVPPSTFLPLARRLGRLPALDHAVIAAAVAEAATWRPAATLTVNLAAETLADRGTGDYIALTLDKHGLPADRLVVEVLESSLIEDDDAALATVERLRAAGVQVAVDDFGAGYASLARLRALAPEIVKIDRSLVAGERDPREPSAFLAGITELAHRLDAVVVAEGVETETQLAAVVAAGCDGVQGFLCGRPTTAEGCRAVLAAASEEATVSLPYQRIS